MGGKNDPTKFYIEPTVVQNVTEKDSLMQEEIFGPILPLVTCESFSEAVDFINSREIPLAGYCFSKGNNKYTVVGETLTGQTLTGFGIFLEIF